MKTTIKIFFIVLALTVSTFLFFNVRKGPPKPTAHNYDSPQIIVEDEKPNLGLWIGGIAIVVIFVGGIALKPRS